MRFCLVTTSNWLPYPDNGLITFHTTPWHIYKHKNGLLFYAAHSKSHTLARTAIPSLPTYTFSILIAFHNTSSNVYSIGNDMADIRNFCQIIANNISVLENMGIRSTHCVHIFFYSLQWRMQRHICTFAGDLMAEKDDRTEQSKCCFQLVAYARSWRFCELNAIGQSNRGIAKLESASTGGVNSDEIESGLKRVRWIDRLNRRCGHCITTRFADYQQLCIHTHGGDIGVNWRREP